jgi:hypothetical protein
MIFDINQKFNFLKNLTQMVINGITPSIVIVGSGGLGKTHTVKSTITESNIDENSYTFIKGYSTARGLYNTLYDNNGKIIIFDDCDSVLDDRVAVNILKSALDSYDSREISWLSKMAKSDEYPNKFEFTGRIIFISNKKKSSIDEAILSRSLTVDLTMTPSEKIWRMKHILPHILPTYQLDIKEDALNFLDQNKDKCQLNMRTLIMISKIRLAHPDNWRQLSTYMINS